RTGGRRLDSIPPLLGPGPSGLHHGHGRGAPAATRTRRPGGARHTGFAAWRLVAAPAAKGASAVACLGQSQPMSPLRQWLAPSAWRRVLVIGDSHVRVFEHWWFRWAMPLVRFDVVYVPGGTATGLPHPRSATRARTRFDDALARGA